MSADPILLLQLQRLGDLILSFPLLLDLKRRYPQTPVWIAAEPAFFEPLIPFTPNVVFFPPSHLPILAREKFSAVFNLGTRPEAALCAARATAPLKFGPLMSDDKMRVAGFWQLYRAALTQNNRHNAFHWADLNRLDIGFPLTRIGRPPPSPAGSGRIGLFLGASEAAKRPDARFWITLARHLARDGFRPVLLGGKAEAEMGARIAAQAGPVANFSGKTSVAQLGALINSLDLLVTPDTGPMHLADWLGRPVLNLSMGNVHALETGPVTSGQRIVRARMSCVGCWQCGRPRLYCKNAFHGASIASLAAAIARGISPSPLPGLEILQAARDENGLYSLKPLHEDLSPPVSRLLEKFWQAAFLFFNDPAQKSYLENSAVALLERYPLLTKKMRVSLGHMLATLFSCLKKNMPLPEGFWKKQPAHSRIFAGYTQMSLQNDSFSPLAMRGAVDHLAALEEIFSRFSGPDI